MNPLKFWLPFWLLGLLLGFGGACPALALLVAPPLSNNNISAPVDDPGWLNVGNNGVYLGNRWVITAFHVGAGATHFPGVGTFAYQAGSAVRLTNPSGMGLTTVTDLLMYRLTTDPGLPALSLANATPAMGTEVTFIGDGAAALPSAALQHWDVTGTAPDFTWTGVPSGGNAHGYYTSVSRKLWGTNLVEDDEAFFSEGDANHTVPASAGFGHVVSLFTEFDHPDYTLGPTTSSETQALGGDSGSAVFAKEGSAWKLVGITHSIATFEDQPFGANTAVYGNLSFFADLSFYRGQIEALVNIPEASSWLCCSVVTALAGWRRGKNWVSKFRCGLNNNQSGQA